MRILHVSNFVQKHNGRLYWNMPFRINNGMTRLGHNVLNFSDRDIARDNILRSSSIGKSDVNNRLIITCKNYQPDLIVLGHSDIIANSTLSHIRNILPNCKIIMWNVDHLLINNTLKKLQDRSEYVDECFITTGDKMISEVAKNKMNIHFIPNIFDSSIDNLKVFEHNNHSYDIFFAMSHGVASGILKKGKTDGREQKLFAIASNPLINEHFYGYDNIEPVWASKLTAEINKCLMGLNLNSGIAMYLYSSDRISTYMGNGLLTFIDKAYGFDSIYKNDEFVSYESDEDLIDKIIYYKSNLTEAKKIAERGWNKSHSDFNGVNVCNYIINKTLDNNFTNNFWPEISFTAK